MRILSSLSLALISVGCAPFSTTQSYTQHQEATADLAIEDSSDQTEQNDEADLIDTHDYTDSTEETIGNIEEPELCKDGIVSPYATELLLDLTETTEDEDIYSIQNRINGVATLFEDCGDSWGLFPTTYRHITARGVRAVEEGSFEDEEWARAIIVDFAGRYLENLRLALQGEEPSWAWQRYYELADRDDVSKTRAVIVAMCAHLMLDLPHSMVAINTTEDNKDDFFMFGDLMIEVSGDLSDDLWYYYQTDAADILNGFFMGRWVDGVFGEETMITLSYQTVRAKSWNNRWYLEQSWGSWIAESEIYTSFWAIDGILRALDGANIID